MLGAVLNSMLDPWTFFRERSTAPSALIGIGCLIMAGSALVGLAALTWGSRMVGGAPGQFRTLFMITFGTSVVASALGTIAGWVILSAAIHVVASGLEPVTHPYQKVLETVGWAHAPMCLYAIVLLVAVFGFPSPVPPASEPTAFVNEIQRSATWVVMKSVGPVVACWSLVLTWIGTRYLYRTSYLRAGAYVGFPVVIALLVHVVTRSLFDF